MSRRVLVCGGRRYGERATVFDALDRIHTSEPISIIIHGGAPGADRLAAAWATGRCVSSVCVPADWERFGRGAGPMRNTAMLVDWTPDLVVAFPGGAGTADMVGKAERGGIRVMRMWP